MSAEAAIAAVPAAAAAAGAQPAAQPAQPAAPWYGEIPDADLKGYTELKAWKTPVDAIKAARDAEKLIGVPKDLLLRLPKPDADQKGRDEAMNDIYNRLGRPATPADYKIPSIEGDESSAKFTEIMKPVLHGIGLSQDQALKLKTAWDGYITEQVKAQDTAQAQREQLDLQNLHKEWPGTVFTEREEMARRAVRNFVNPIVTDPKQAEELLGSIEDAVGTATFLKLFSGIGEKLSESRYVDGNNKPTLFGMTPAAAKTRKAELMADPDWAKRALIKGSVEAAELDRLQRLQASGSVLI